MTMNQQQLCACGSNKFYKECCCLLHQDYKKAESAEQLMRARYAAYVVHDIDFIYSTFHPSTRRFQNKKDIESWAKESKWMQLEVIKATTNTVEFKAHYLDNNMNVQIHHEKSNFKQVQNIWFYVDGKTIS